MPQLLCQQPFPTPDEGRDGDAAAAELSWSPTGPDSLELV